MQPILVSASFIIITSFNLTLKPADDKSKRTSKLLSRLIICYNHICNSSAVKYHPDPEKLQLFSAGEDYHIRVWDLPTSSCITVLEGHYSIITSLLFSPDAHALYRLALGRNE